MEDPLLRQRTLLCDLLESLSEEQWAAETLCEGWDAGDIAAHLLVREREPMAAAGLVVPPLAGFTESRTASRKEIGREELIRQLREGTPRLAKIGVMGRIQVSEDYIHTEDVRRGGAAALPGTTLTPDDGTADAATDELLWQAIGRFALGTLAGLDASGVLAMTDGGRTRAYKVGGLVPLPAKDGAADATVSGTAGELLLFITGRTAADVSLHGDEALIAALEAKGRSV